MRRAWVTLAVATVMLALRAKAQDAPQRAILPVSVNETPRGEVTAYVSGDDVLVAKSFLDPFAFPAIGAATHQLDEGPFVSLKALAPNLTFKFDPADLTLGITVAPEFLRHSDVALQRFNIADDRGGDPSLFANYAVNGVRGSSPGFFGEFGAAKGQRFAYTGLSRSGGQGFVRGLTYLNSDSPATLRRWTVGDAVVGGSDLLGGTSIIGGVTLSRQFSLQPYLIRSPALDVNGTAVTPSTVEVYVNGQLMSRVNVTPGPFTLHDLPVVGGLGDTRIVVRDVFGRETVQESAFYYSTNILRKGLSDYIFSGGMIRDNLAKSFDYSDPAALAQYRRGVTDSITLGGRGEATRDVVSGGPRITFGTNYGDIDLEAAASQANGLAGSAGSASYRFTSRRYSFGGSFANRSHDYATISLKPSDDRTTKDWNVFTSAIVGRMSIGFVGTRSDQRDAGQTFRRVAVQVNAPAGRYANVFGSVGRVRNAAGTFPEVFLGLTLSLGRNTAANVLLERTEGKDGSHVEIRRPIGTANGLGYAVSNDSVTGQRRTELEYQTSFGRYGLFADPDHAGDFSYSAAGGVVMIGNRVIPSRALQEGYALARVGVPGVRIFASNQEVGKTTASGDLLISSLLPHYVNDLRISDKDVPIDYVVEGTEVTVVPPSRGGVVARFPIHKLHSYTGSVKFMIIGQPYVPGLGLIDVERAGDPLTLALGESGEFYVEDLDAGTYQAHLRIGKVHCDFNLVLPKTDAPLTDIGVIPCAP